MQWRAIASMEVINIFLTSALEAGTEDFVHNGHRFVFDTIGPDGPERLVDGPIWAFVDWVMDDLAGLEMCRRLRADERTSHAHVTMVLEEDDAEDRRRSLKAGADDYMVGPLDRTKVLDRVLALQSSSCEPHVIRSFEHGALVIDMAALRARWNGQVIEARPNEFRLLRYFAQNAGVVMSRDEIIAGLGKGATGSSGPPLDERTVDVWVGRLRRAIKAAGGGNPLRTVRSRGYVLDLS